MTTPRETIQSDLKNAMKAGDKIRVGTLRMLLAEIKNEAIRTGEELDQSQFVTAVQRGLKQRREAAAQFRNGDRIELAEKEEAEAEILESYLPEQVDPDEVRAAIAELIERDGLEGPKAMGRVMGAMMARFKGRIDGKTVQTLAREALG